MAKIIPFPSSQINGKKQAKKGSKSESFQMERRQNRRFAMSESLRFSIVVNEEGLYTERLKDISLGGIAFESKKKRYEEGDKLAGRIYLGQDIYVSFKFQIVSCRQKESSLSTVYGGELLSVPSVFKDLVALLDELAIDYGDLKKVDGPLGA